MSRKYSQSGYMDSDRKNKPLPRLEKPEKSEFSVNSRVETKFNFVTRCNNCAAEIQMTVPIQAIDRCRKCGNDLHSCRNCRNFDPSARNECVKPVASSVAGKNKNNFCTFFEAKTLIEKQGSGAVPAATGRSTDLRRQAFFDLFKN